MASGIPQGDRRFLLDRLHFFVHALFRRELFAGRVRRERRAVSLVARCGAKLLPLQLNWRRRCDMRIVVRIENTRAISNAIAFALFRILLTHGVCPPPKVRCNPNASICSEVKQSEQQ